MRKILAYSFLLMLLALTNTAKAVETYTIDTKGAHAFIQFKINHLSYSWLYGRFNKFEGSFTIDRDNLENSSVFVTIDPASVDSNHAERDKHLRSDDFLDISKFPTASFKSTSLKLKDGTSGVLTGDLTIKDVTKSIDIDIELVGEGKDPWGKYRAGFQGSTTLTLKDFNITKNLGPDSTQVEMILSIEGIRQ